MVVAAMAVSSVVGITSCDGTHPIEVIQTDYKYTIDIDDVHIAEGARAECVIRLSQTAGRDEAVTVEYRIDDDATLHIYVNDKEVASGSQVSFSSTGTLKLTLPELPEGTHVLHLSLTNQYGKTFSKDVTFEVIRDKVWAKAVKAPAKVIVERGAFVDTTVTIEPADADVLALSVKSSDESLVRASLSGDGATKSLRIDGMAEGAASVSLFHEDIEGTAAEVAVEVFSYKIEGLPEDMTVTEGDAITLTLSAVPQAQVTVSSSASCVTVSSPTSTTGTWTLKAESPGKAVITATAGRTQSSFTVTVNKKPETIAISPMGATIEQGGTKTFTVVSSADFTADLSSDAATITERSANSVTVRNDNRSFKDAKVTLTVSNAADPTKRAVADITLEKRAETITLTESVSEQGRSIWTVGGENEGWEIVEYPSGVKCEPSGSTITLVNNTYKSIGGRLSVKTKVQGVTATKDAVVPGLEVKLSALKGEPSFFTVEEGHSFTVAVTGTYSDGTSKDVTSAVTWTQSSNLTRSGSVFTAGEPGSAWVRATLDDKFVNIDGNVTKKPVNIQSLSIDPAYFNALVGESKLFSVTANFSDGVSKDVTRECEWTITGPAQESGKGYYKMVDVGEVLVEAAYTYNGTTLSARSIGTVTKPSGTVTGVSIDPKEKAMKVGETVSFTGVVRYSDGTTDAAGTFTVSPGGILSGADGSYVAIAAGSATVTYAYSGYSASAVVTVSAGEGQGGDASQLQSLVLNTPNLTIYSGKTNSVTATAVFANGTASDVTSQCTWSSSNTGVATVDGGRITGVKAGTATVSAMYLGKTAGCAVTVEDEVVIRTVSVTPSSLAFMVGDQPQTLSAKAYYSNGTSKDVTALAEWKSSDAGVASVSAGGIVTPVAAGNVTISASFEGQSGTCGVTVSTPPQTTEKIVLNTTSITLTAGKTYQLDGTVYCKNPDKTYAAKDVCRWTSSDGTVATVNGSGLVTAIKAGVTVITAENLGATATCTVTVEAAPVTLTGLSVAPTEISVAQSASYTLPGSLRATASYSDNTTRDVTSAVSWSMESNSYASLSGLTITGVKASGYSSASLTASYTDGGVTKTAGVAVKVTEGGQGTVTGIVASPTSISLVVGDTPTAASKVAIKASFSDGSTKDVTSDCNWEIANQYSNTAYMNGATIVARNAGSAVLTAKYSSFTADIYITVTAKTVPVTKVALNKTTMTVPVNGSETLSVIFNDGGEVPTNTAVKWTTTSAGIAKVDGNGKVTGVAVGECSVTVTTDDGGKTASCKVTVTPEIIAVTGVSVAPTTASVVAGNTVVLTATVAPSNASNKGVSWSSSDKSVATVDNNGTVTGVEAGNARITVTTDDGGKTATCAVTVTAAPVAVTGVAVYAGSEDVTGKTRRVPIGETLSLSAKVSPENASITKTEWSSEDGSGAIKVDANGKVSVENIKTAKVSVKVTDKLGNVKTASVTIEGYQETYSIVASPTELKWDWNKGGSSNAKRATIKLTNLSGFTWKLSNESYFAVSTTDSKTYIDVYTKSAENGDTERTAYLTLTDTDNKSKTCRIDLKWDKKPDAVAAKVTLAVSNVSGTPTVKPDSNLEIVATVIDNYGNKMPDAAVRWTTDPDGYVEVTPEKDSKVAKMKAKATADGVKVYATVSNTTVKSEGYAVNALVPVSEVKLSETAVTLKKGDEKTLTATVYPASGLSDVQKKVSWSSSNTGVATVDGGKVKAVAPGEANIVVTNDFDKTKTATCKVTVPQPVTEIYFADANVNSLGTKVSSLIPENGGGFYTETYEKDYYLVVSPANSADKSVEFGTLDGVSVTAGALANYNGIYYHPVHISLSKTVKGTFTATAKDGSGVSGSLYIDATKVQKTTPYFGHKNSAGIIEAGLPDLVIYMGTEGALVSGYIVYAGVRAYEIGDGSTFNTDPAGIVNISRHSASSIRIKPVAVGKTKVYGKVSSAGDTWTSNYFTVEVKNQDVPPTPTDPTLTVSPTSLSMSVGGSSTLKATAMNVGTEKITWSVNDGSIVLLYPTEGSTISVFAKDEGTAKITAKCGTLTCDVSVTVSGNAPFYVEELNAQSSGNEVKIIATLESTTTGQYYNEDVTEATEIIKCDSGLTVTKKNTSVNCYYEVSASKDGTYKFTVRYLDDQLTVTVVKKGNSYTIN